MFTLNERLSFFSATHDDPASYAKVAVVFNDGEVEHFMGVALVSEARDMLVISCLEREGNGEYYFEEYLIPHDNIRSVKQSFMKPSDYFDDLEERIVQDRAKDYLEQMDDDAAGDPV